MARWRERWIFVGALALASCATVPRAADEGGPTWVRVESDHFILESDLGDRKATELAGELERWRLAMTASVLPGAVEPRNRLRVVALGPGELRATGSKLAGMYSDGPFVGRFLLVGTDYRWDTIRIVKHELAHAVIGQNLPQVPQWLDEGMAAFLETTELDVDTGAVEWGARHEGLSFQSLRIENLEGLFDPRPWPHERRRDYTFFASRVVRMLVRSHPDQLACYEVRLQRFEEPTAARDLCFPTRDTWPSEIAHDGWGNARPSGKARIPLPPIHTRLARMSDGEVHATLALVETRVAAMMPDHDAAQGPLLASSERHLQRARALDRANPLANALAISRRGEDPRAWRDATFAAVRLYPDDWRAWVLRAFTPGVPDAERWAAAEQALRLEPDRGEARQELGLRALREGRWSEAEELERESTLLMPGSATPRALWFTALERQGKCDDAARVLNNAPLLRAEISDIVTRRLFVTLAVTAPRCPLTPAQ